MAAGGAAGLAWRTRIQGQEVEGGEKERREVAGRVAAGSGDGRGGGLWLDVLSRVCAKRERWGFPE